MKKSSCLCASKAGLDLESCFEGITYDIGNRFEWIKTSIEYALEDDEFKDDLVEYMKTYI